MIFPGLFSFYGARGGTRTPTPLLASGPKPGASTNFATRAVFLNAMPSAPSDCCSHLKRSQPADNHTLTYGLPAEHRLTDYSTLQKHASRPILVADR